MDDASLIAQILPAVLSHENDVRRAAEAQLNVRAAITCLSTPLNCSGTLLFQALSRTPGFLPALLALLLAPDAAECQRQVRQL